MSKMWFDFVDRVKQWCIDNLREHTEYGMVEAESLANAAMVEFNIVDCRDPGSVPDWLCEVVDEAIGIGW